MKTKAILAVLFVAGLAASFAVAGPPPGKGKNKGDAVAQQTTATTGTTGTTTTEGKKVTICHKTGSKKKPWHRITISRSALPAHMAHGDRMPPCPQAPGTGGGTTSGTTGTTGTTTTTAATAQPDSGKGKGKNKDKKPKK